MRWCRVLLAVTGTGLLSLSLMTSARADDRNSPEAIKARERFAKLLLPDGTKQQATKAIVKRRKVVVNAFAGPPGTPVVPGRPGNRPL